MSTLWSDIRVAMRGLIKTPRFSLMAIAALALGIGPNTAIFSIVYGTLLAPLPFPQPDQLVMVWSKEGDSRARTSPAEYLDWKQQAKSFQFLEPFWARQFNLATADAPERVRARQVSPDGHRLFGEGVWLGRDFRADDDQPGKNHVVLLTHRLWRARFGADPNIVGRDIRMDGTPYTVIGVLLPGQRDRLPADLWIPLSLSAGEKENRQFRPLLITGRLKPGVTIEQAQAEMDIVAKDLAQRFPASNTGRTISVEPLQNNFLAADLATNLWLLLAAVSFVVLIASVNVANLLLSRGAAREHETAIRAALGATPGRLARQVLIDSLLLAAAGGVLGALSSVWILQGILAILPPGTLPAEADPRLSLPVLSFTLIATTMSGLLCGAAQAWQGSRRDAHDALKQAGRNATGWGRRRLHRAFVVVEFAMAVALLAGAGLTIVSFWNRTQVDLGVRTDNILTFGLPVNEGRLTTTAAIDTFYREVIDRLEAVPGVAHASVSAPGLPLGSGFAREFRVAGLPNDTLSSRRNVSVRMVTPEYFDTFGIRLVRGRALTAVDGSNTQRVAVVNERFVKLFLEGREALDQRVVMNGFVPRAAGLGPGAAAPGPPAEWQIVGVFRNVSNADRFGDLESPEIYVPFAQSPWPQVTVAVRSATIAPDALRRSVASAIQAIHPDLPLTDVRTMEQIVGERLAPDRLNIALYGGLAVLALVLAALGIYGVMAYAVTQRVPEIGLRIALGAGRTQVRMQILREGMTLAAGGLLLGLAGAYALGRAMQSTLYGTTALSLPVLLAVGTVLLTTAAAACYLPARRASAVDPMIALRRS
jgi:putative ABC transport system permease protein